MKILRLENVNKSFGSVHAVRDLSLDIADGSIFGLLGPNGAGKTTTIRMIMQIIIPDSGQISLFGQPNSHQSLDSVGYLPEERGLYRKMKVIEELQFFGELKGMSPTAAREKANYWLERFEMGEVAAKKVEELSKGNQQKIQFISTVMHEPRLIILDEPFSGLDPVNVELLKDIMLELKAAQQCIVFSTHVMEQVEKLCDNICLINNGQGVLQGNLKEIKKSFGRNTVQLEYDGEIDFLKGLDFVQEYSDYGNYVELKLRDAARAQELAKLALENTTVQRFEIMEPSLHEIFIETVKSQA